MTGDFLQVFQMLKMTQTAKLVTVMSYLLLSGCVLAPGQYVKPDAWLSGRDEQEVEVIPITPKLFATEPSAIHSEELPQDLLDYQPGIYRIGAGDTLYITVWDHPELTVPSGTQLNNSDANGRLVRPDGTLFYPYIGAVQANGMTLEELRAELAKRLAKYIDSPQVDVAVLRYGSQKVYVSGAFLKNTPVPVTTVPLSLPDALGQAGIDNVSADLSGLVLERDGVRYVLNMDRLAQKGKGLAKIFLKPDDALYLPYNDRRKVYVLGEVTSQKALPFKTDGISLAEAIASVGGLRQETSRARSVYVIRGVDVPGSAVGPQTTVYQMNANSSVALAMSDRFQLRPGDMVYVGPAQITRWNRFISSLLPSASLLNTADNIRN